MTYLNQFKTQVTPQSQPIPGSAQQQNNAGGYSFFVIDDWGRLDRFLVLGSEGGTYYVGEREMTKQSAEAVLRCIAQDGARVVKRVVEISDAGRAPKNNPALFVLALSACAADRGTRSAALAALPKVARIGTHLFHFVQYLKGNRGWGKGLRHAIARWYDEMPAARLAYQAVKYQQRDGWAHRDLLRLAHPKTQDATRNGIYKWIVDGWPDVGEGEHPDEVLRFVWAFERAKVATSAAEVVRLVTDYKLPREAVPTQWLTNADVWAALLYADMPMTAMIRNLATMTRVGLLAPMAKATKRVVQELQNAERLKASRVHPIAVLSALRTYAQGHGERSGNTWQPVREIIDALDGAFYASFGNIHPAGKRTMLALDISGSMGMGEIAGVPGLTPREASAAMALVTAATEPEYCVYGFGTRFHTLPISPRQRLDDVVKAISNLHFEGTDCALPMIHALRDGLSIDTFAVYTDNETWAGAIHPSQALAQYGAKTGTPARLVVVGMTATEFSIADPRDAGMLDVVGFDTAAPQLMADFSAGR